MIWVMPIKNFKDPRAAALWRGEYVKAFSSFDRQALNRLVQLDVAASLNDLAAIRSNRLEALKGSRKASTAFESTINTAYASARKTVTL
jgi:plasmid maintenance system killer protein